MVYNLRYPEYLPRLQGSGDTQLFRGSYCEQQHEWWYCLEVAVHSGWDS